MNIALRSCKASAENIARILRPHSLALDAEFLVVAETVDQTLKSASCLPQLETFAASDPKSLVLRFAELLARQLEHLERLQRDQNAFLSCLQSPRLNHAILGRSTLIFQALCNIVDAANMIRPIEDNKLGECTPKVVLALSSVPGIALSNTAHTAPEDPKAQLFWTQNWSAEVRSTLVCNLLRLRWCLGSPRYALDVAEFAFLCSAQTQLARSRPLRPPNALF